jgi:hypothetical protein
MIQNAQRRGQRVGMEQFCNAEVHESQSSRLLVKVRATDICCPSASLTVANSFQPGLSPEVEA